MIPSVCWVTKRTRNVLKTEGQQQRKRWWVGNMKCVEAPACRRSSVTPLTTLPPYIGYDRLGAHQYRLMNKYINMRKFKWVSLANPTTLCKHPRQPCLSLCRPPSTFALPRKQCVCVSSTTSSTPQRSDKWQCGATTTLTHNTRTVAAVTVYLCVPQRGIPLKQDSLGWVTFSGLLGRRNVCKIKGEVNHHSLGFLGARPLLGVAH